MMKILTLCTGNVCRSPLAALLLADRLDPTRFKVTSAGISPLVGDRMPVEAQQVAARWGFVEAAEHRARSVTKDEISTSELVIGMSRSHLTRAVQLHPPAVKRAFTLLELAQIVAHISDAHISTLIHGAPDTRLATFSTIKRMRGVVPRLHPEQRYDVENPYGRSRSVYERSAGQIAAAVDRIADFFDRALPPPQSAEPVHTTTLIRRYL